MLVRPWLAVTLRLTNRLGTAWHLRDIGFQLAGGGFPNDESSRVRMTLRGEWAGIRPRRQII
jgi:hypothetical protein